MLQGRFVRRLEDARHEALGMEGRFDLAYNAAPALALAALRYGGIPVQISRRPFMNRCG